MSDGSAMGITAGRALATIIGGQEQPVMDERYSPESVLSRLMECPLPGDGLPPWKRPDLDADLAYSFAADCIARAMLETTSNKHRAENCSAAWNRAKTRWPNLNEWVGGASGFQVGFAWNLVRYTKGWVEQSNPAII